MAEDLAKLVLRMEAQTAQYQRELEKSREKLNRVDRATKKMQENTSRRFALMEKGAGRLKAAVGAAVVAFATQRFAGWIKQSIDGADRANKFAQQVGVATETLTGLNLGLELSGTSSKAFETSLTRLNRSISDAAQGLATQKRAFNDLGVEVVDSRGKLRSTEEVLRDISDRFASMEDGARKTARAQELLGRSGAELIPFLNQGSDGLDAMIERSRALGLVWTQESAAAAEAFNDNLTVLAGTNRGIANSIAQQLLPTLNNLSSMMIDVAEDGELANTTARVLAGGMKLLASAAVLVSNTFKTAGSFIGGVAAAAVQAAQGNFSQAKNIISQIPEEIGDTWKANLARLEKIWDETSGSAEKNAEKIRAAAAVINAGGGPRYKPISDEASNAAKELDKLISRASTVTKEWRRARDAANQQLQGVVDSLMTEEEQIRASYERRQQIILENTEATSQKQADLLARLEMQKNQQLEELNRGYWERYLAAADEALTNLNDIAATTISSFASGVGNAFESMIFDATTASEAFRNLAEGMARAIINALGQMAAQWAAYQLVQLAVGKTTAAASAGSMVAQAQAASAQAALNAYASTAAIPIVGPAAAPAAAAAATAATAPYVATVAATSFAGMFDKGGDIPAGMWGIAAERGMELVGNQLLRQPSIVQGPAHVTSRADTASMLGQKPEVNLRNINVLDPRVVGDYLGTDEGEQQIVNIMQKNRSAA